jgi:hypothetical protein
MSVTDLRLERIKKSADNTKCDPLDTLLVAHEELSNGAPIRKMLLIVETENPDGTRGLDSFRAGVSRYEEIALLRLQEISTLEKWRSK